MAQNYQKIEILEARCRDYQDREVSLKKLNNSIMLALNDLTAESEKNARKIANKEIDFLQKKQDFELKEIKLQYEGQIKALELQNKELEEKVRSLYEDYKRENDKILEEKEENIRVISKELTNLRDYLYEKEEDFRKNMEKSTFENKRKINDLEFEIEKFKALENKEKQEIRVFRINEIENMRNLHEKEIQDFQAKIADFQREKDYLMKINEQNIELYEDLKKRLYDEISSLKAQILSKDQETQTLNEKLFFSEQNIKEKEAFYEQEITRIKEMNRQELDENKKLRAKILAYQNSMKTLEKSEKALKQTLYEKGLLIESEKNELKKLLSYEKIKGDRMQILASDIKEEYMRKNAFLMQELLNKDETIKKLTANMIRTQIIKDLIRNHDKIIQEKETERTQEKLEIREILDKSSESKENKDFLPSKTRTKSYSASNTNKTKSFIDEKTLKIEKIDRNFDENITKITKIECKKLENNKRATSRLKIMRKGSFYDKENMRLMMSDCNNPGNSLNICKNLSLRTINEEILNKALSIKNN